MESTDHPLEKTMNNDSCAHLNEVAADVKDNYHIVLAFYVTCIAKEAFSKKATDASCSICKESDRRLHACLECAYFGCFDPCEFDEENRGISHMKEHAVKSDHYFAISINYGNLFCYQCNDYVYSKMFEDILNEYKVEAREAYGFQSYLPWEPKLEEIALMKNKIKKISNDPYIGLRGIVNLGRSCCVNSVIQVFMHNPVLKYFFLCDRHKCFIKVPHSCLTCEMLALFQEFYSGITVPFNPLHFSWALQKFCKCGLGEESQDAYELFQEILVGLLSSCQEKHGKDNCNCIIHRTFYGTGQIFRECAHCNASSLLPLDHFVDILLELKGSDDTLVEILKRKFSIPELLYDYKCSTCFETNTTYSYPTIKKLPIVICFRVNCFGCYSYESGIKTLKKKSTAFVFEESIDMSDYLNLKGDKLPNRRDISNSCTILNRYYLFGIIFHKGNLTGGHYSAYVKHHNRWFECDDNYVYERSFECVLKCEPFLLFYCKQL